MLGCSPSQLRIPSLKKIRVMTDWNKGGGASLHSPKTTYFCFLQLWHPKGVKKPGRISLGNLWAENGESTGSLSLWLNLQGFKRMSFFFSHGFIKAQYANLTFLGMPLDLKFLSWNKKNLLLPLPPCWSRLRKSVSSRLQCTGLMISSTKKGGKTATLTTSYLSCHRAFNNAIMSKSRITIWFSLIFHPKSGIRK